MPPQSDVVLSINYNEFVRQVVSRFDAILADTSQSDLQKYQRIRNFFFRAHLEPVALTLLHELGPVIQSGPFQGMKFLGKNAEGCYIPKLLGCYEEELHPVLNRIRDRDYRRIINIGCAEGYYAVGLARMFPESEVYAYDITEVAQQFCAELAELNEVSGRVHIAGLLTPEGLMGLIQDRTLLFCDIEGNEYPMLDRADVAEALRDTDMIVELHHNMTGNLQLTQDLVNRYQDTHEVVIVDNGGRNPDAFPVLREFNQFEKFLACCELRPRPTPWGVFLARNK